MATTIDPCACDGSAQNFGQPGCLTKLGAPYAVVIAQRKTSAGADNFMDLTAVWDQTYIESFYCAEDDQNRYFIIPNIKGYTPAQADPVTDEAANGDIDTVRDGIASMMFEFRGNDIYKSLAKWKGVACLDMMAYLIDTDGNLLGKCEANDMFGGLLIAKNSYITIAQPNDFAGTNKYTVQFNLELGSGWDKVDYVAAADLTDYSLLDIEPLRDVNVKITAITATTIDFVTTLDYGSAKNRSTKGLDVFTDSDLQLFNVTDSAIVAFATLAVDPAVEGGYNGTMVSQDSTDVIYVDPILNVIKPLALNRFPSITTIIP